MNSVKVYRLKWFYRYYIPVLFGLAVLGSALLTGWPFLWSMFSPSHLSETWWLLLWLVLALATFALFLLYLWLVNWKARLVLAENYLSFETIPHLAMRPFYCTYEDIVRVERAEAGVLRVIPPQGQPLVIAPAVFEGKADELLAELHQRIGRAKFESLSKVQLNRKDRWDYLLYTTIGIMIVVLLGYIYANSLHPLVRQNIAWHSVGTFVFLDRVETITVEQGGAVLAVVREGIARNRFIQRITPNNKTTRWELPPSATDDYSETPLAVASSKSSWPTVLLENGQVLRLNEQGWHTVVLPEKVERFFASSLIASNSKIWAISYTFDNRQLLMEVDAETGQARALVLPEAVVNSDWEFISLGQAPNQALVAKVRRRKTYRFFIWENAHWREVGQELELPIPTFDSFGVMTDGQLWVVANEHSSDKDTLALWLYGADQQWHVYKTSTHLDTQASQLDVDGRLWVEHRDGLDVFERATSGELRLIVRYTKENSGYQASYARGAGQLYLDAEGHLWTFDNIITHIDTKAVVLPTPLPDWVVGLTSQVLWAALQGSVSVLMLVVMLVRNHRLWKVKAQ